MFMLTDCGWMEYGGCVDIPIDDVSFFIISFTITSFRMSYILVAVLIFTK